MKNNQPVSQVEIPFPKGRYIVSRTDLKGLITYANDTDKTMQMKETASRLRDLIGYFRFIR